MPCTPSIQVPCCKSKVSQASAKADAPMSAAVSTLPPPPPACALLSVLAGCPRFSNGEQGSHSRGGRRQWVILRARNEAGRGNAGRRERRARQEQVAKQGGQMA
jgi:hypothetical protein